MLEGGVRRHFRNGNGGRRGSHGRAWRSRRAVSDVVATILLLALTVVLFASIFAFVTSFPAPPAQNSNQFQAQLITVPNATGVGGELTGVSILHLAGPSVSPGTLIYLKSAVHPTWPQFTSPYTLTQGGIPAGTVWNLGQTWLLSSLTGGFSYIPDNITVYIVSGPNLLFSAIIPGTVINLPPTYLTVGTNLPTPALGEAFTITATIGGITSASKSVTISVAGLPLASQPAAVQRMWNINGVWTYNESAGNTTASGNYYAFITATTVSGKTGSSAVSVDITPYSTLIATAITVSNAPTIGKYTCTSANHPSAACQASGDYVANVTITSSLVTFGSVLFEIYNTSSGAILSAKTHVAFAIALNSALTTPVWSWVLAGGGSALVSTSTGVTTYASGSSTTPLTNLYTISIDLGTAKPGTNTLEFFVLGTGPYSGQTAAAVIP